MTRASIFTLTLCVLCAVIPLLSIHSAGAVTDCPVSASGQKVILVKGICVYRDNRTDEPKPRVRTVSCGRAGLGDAGWNPICGRPLECYVVKAGQGNVQVDAFITQTRVGGQWENGAAWCPGDTQPAVTSAAIREQALRLLPHVAIGSAWTDTALVNAQVILWADTADSRDLPSVTIVGQRVALRIDRPEAHWTFGDGDIETTSDLGKPYDAAGDPCRTAQCEHYFGHTYRHTGHPQITLQINWLVHYRIGDGDWTNLPGDALTGPTATHDLTVEQARSVLIDNPH